MKSKTFNKVTLRCKQGDISLEPADAVVNAANNQLWMGAGVAGALKRRGGPELEAEAVSKGPIPLGEAAVTKGYALPAKYVIHAAAMGSGVLPDADLIYKATYNSLLRAQELRLRTVAFPALGTGVGGFPLRQAARIMEKAVRDFAEKSEAELEVTFVLYDERALAVFEEELFSQDEA